MARSKSDDEVAVGTVADMLIQAGCEIESRAGTDGFSDFTVLKFSAYHGHVGVVRHLIDARCEINAQSSVGLVLEGFLLRKLQLLEYCFLQSLAKKLVFQVRLLASKLFAVVYCTIVGVVIWK